MSSSKAHIFWDAKREDIKIFVGMQFDDVLGNYKEFSNYSINHLAIFV